MIQGRGRSSRLRGVFAQAEQECKRAVAYVNDRVVPEVRREGGQAMAVLAVEMRRVADKLEGRAKPFAG